ncbi:MAG: hypothetical protein IPK15_07045 [Verrucomicrobia bacterium]|nr:hypothetical protein [Verrucomicrobiota bacterium]
MPDNSTDSAPASGATVNNSVLTQRLRAALELLETAAANRTVIADLTAGRTAPTRERRRGDIFCPDVSERRRVVKARVRQRKAEKKLADDQKLHQTGIRELRRKPVFTTPNFFPPVENEPREVADDPDFREVIEPQNCYICKRTIRRFTISTISSVRFVRS